ncbi:MAG: hypothetical protein JWL99_5048 [Streptomyces oryziradicis]|nr:hypothetical protein [Actinacidiphila oryziradicis]
MIADAKAGKFDVIVVYYISRFSRRELKDAVSVIMDLQSHGIQIISVQEGAITDDLVGLITLMVRADAAHKESLLKSAHVSATKRQLKAGGGFVGGVPPYGFDTAVEHVNGLTIRALVHNPSEVEIIRGMVRRILDHKDVPFVPGKSHPGSLTGVCADLNERGVPTRGVESHARRGIKEPSWNVTTIRRVLTDPRLMGHQTEPVYETVQKSDGTGTWQKRTGYRSVRDEHGKPVISHDPIISAAEYHELQQCLAIAKNGTKPKGTLLTRGDSLLSGIGILKCESGHPMNKQAGKTAALTTYRCAARKSSVKQHEGMVSILRDRLEEHVGRSVIVRLAELDPENSADLELLAEATRRFTATVAAPETAAERSALVAERADYKAAQDELYDDYDAGVYKGTTGRERFIQKRDKLEDALRAVDERIAALDDIRPAVLSVDTWTQHDGDPIGPGSWWHGASIPDKRAFLALFIDGIRVRKAANWGTSFTPEPVTERVTIKWAGEASE